MKKMKKNIEKELTIRQVLLKLKPLCHQLKQHEKAVALGLVLGIIVALLKAFVF